VQGKLIDIFFEDSGKVSGAWIQTCKNHIIREEFFFLLGEHII
jgi:hypothetical protein